MRIPTAVGTRQLVANQFSLPVYPDDDDIAMPDGPPPGMEEDGDDVDDIPMPDGAPPGQSPEGMILPSPGTAFEMTICQGPTSLAPPLSIFTPSQSSSLPPPPPPPPPGFVGGPIPGFPYPPPPNLLSPAFPSFSPTGIPPHVMPFPPPPPPPPGFFPRRNQSASAMQDPLSSFPHQTFQAHREAKQTLLPHPSLPSKPAVETAFLPNNPSIQRSAGELAAATVSAEPQLRDFKKEATAFVPASLKRKKMGASSSSTTVNAAPDTGETDLDPSRPARPDLVGALKDRFGPASAPVGNKGKAEEKKKSDYHKFLDEMSDLL